MKESKIHWRTIAKYDTPLPVETLTQFKKEIPQEVWYNRQKLQGCRSFLCEANGTGICVFCSGRTFMFEKDDVIKHYTINDEKIY